MLDGLNLGFGKKLSLVLQTEGAECGLACLAMVAAFHGYQTDLPHLRRKFTVSLKGLNLAQLIQEMWRRAGVHATVTSVDFPVFQERLRTGRFDTFVGSWLDEPSPRSLGDQWTTAGIGILNYTGYRSSAFDSLFRRAATFQGGLPLAQRAWKEAIAQLNADVPGIWLYTPMNTAAVTRRLGLVTIDPYSWLSRLPEWSLTRER